MRFAGIFGILALPLFTLGQVILSPGNNSQVEFQLPSNAPQTVILTDIPDDVEYAIIQVHSHLYNISASYNLTLSPGYYAIGTNVGLVLGRGEGQTPLTSPIYISHGNALPVQVLLSLDVYSNTAPIPGGCNMEVSIKTAPFLPTSFSQPILVVEYPLGSWPLNVRPATCDRAPLQYDIYELYLPERDVTFRTAFDSIRLMTGVSSIETNGRKVSFSGSPPSKVKFSNYAGTGRIVAVIVRTLTDSAAYVPTLSYGCNQFSDDETESCEVLEPAARIELLLFDLTEQYFSWWLYWWSSICLYLDGSPCFKGKGHSRYTTIGAKLLCGFMVFVGIFLTYLGHRFYKSQLYFLGFSVSSLVFYVILVSLVEVTPSVAGMTATSVGAIGGALWLALWARWGAPVAPIFLAAFVLGILFASMVAYTPLADYSILKDNGTFWLAFFCLVLVIPLAVLSFGRLTSILWCALVGSYIFIVPVDHYVGSNLKYIVLNILRRATIGEFNTAIVDPPYQTRDIILTVVWALLFATGAAFQWWRERGRAPFPPAPTWPSRRPTTTVTDNNPTEATHLLS